MARAVYLSILDILLLDDHLHRVQGALSPKQGAFFWWQGQLLEDEFYFG